MPRNIWSFQKQVVMPRAVNGRFASRYACAARRRLGGRHRSGPAPAYGLGDSGLRARADPQRVPRLTRLGCKPRTL
jgi:hypothetical protein